MKRTTPLNLVLSLLAGATLLAACGSDSDIAEPTPTTAPTIDADVVVFIWTETGGCMMAGPNCARYEVQADGTVNTYRGDQQDPAAIGTVDQGIVDAWMQVAGQTDIDALTGRLGPGELTAAFDGVDSLLEAPANGFILSSVDWEFARAEPLFESAAKLQTAAARAAPLELETR